jgi:hypothetical protein
MERTYSASGVLEIHTLPLELQNVEGSQHLPNLRKCNPDNTAKYPWDFIIANIAN